MAEQPRFDSMDQAAEALRYWPKDLPFPLRDTDAPEIWLRACESKTIAAALAQKKEQKEWDARLNGRDAAVLLSYEDNAQKLERKLGWSALDLWARAYDDMRGHWSRGNPAPMSKGDMAASFKALVTSGAHMEAAFWTRPDLPFELARVGLLDEMTLLCAAGFPLDRPFTMSAYSSGIEVGKNLFTFAAACSGIDGVSEELSREATRRALCCAMEQGLTLEERDTTGHTALGVAAALRTSSSVLMQELLDLGADPTRVSRHPLAICANEPKLAQAALSAYQRRALLESEPFPARGGASAPAQKESSSAAPPLRL